MTDNKAFLIAPSISSIPSSLTSNFSIRIGGDPESDVERASAGLSCVTSQNSASQHLNSPFLRPTIIWLFGSNEVYSNDLSSPHLHREYIEFY